MLFKIDNAKNSENKQKEIEFLEMSIAKREKLLSNEGFVSRAPKNIVEEEQNKLKEEKEKLSILKAD